MDVFQKPTIPGNRVKQLQSKGGSSLKPRYQGNSEFVSESHAGTTNSSLETAQYTGNNMENCSITQQICFSQIFIKMLIIAELLKNLQFDGL